MHWKSLTCPFACLVATSLWTVPACAAPDASGEIDLFELRLGKDEEQLLVQSTWTLGSGEDQAVFKLDSGSDTRAGFDDTEAQALYSHALGDKAALLMGVRHHFRSCCDHSYAVRQHSRHGLKANTISTCRTRETFLAARNW
ncbi:hypothetical protein GCM10011349_44490 [Novosphingobium indicum]|uniref:Uncharacterized protein n=1 Tax=Novosphingobium indicum TaxID=462949 RepID=A0ABQ2K0T7_9SPHN|nr:hypothetical protein GCM10011349_44490 [Novosphingobium indicum]